MGNFSFNIKTSIDLFKVFKEDYSDFKSNDTDSRKAIHCALTAWHLVEWIRIEFHSQKGLIDFQNELKQKCPSLQIMQDISNGTKHTIITKYPSKIKNTSTQDGSFSNAFSSAFDISYLAIELNDGSMVSFKDEIENVIKFWTNYLKNDLLLKF